MKRPAFRALLIAALGMPFASYAQAPVSTTQLPSASPPAPTDLLQITQPGGTRQAPLATAIGAVAPLLSNNLADVPSPAAARLNLGLGPYATAPAGSIVPTASQILSATPVAGTGNLGVVRVTPGTPLAVDGSGALSVAITAAHVAAAQGYTSADASVLTAEQTLARSKEAAALAAAVAAQVTANANTTAAATAQTTALNAAAAAAAITANTTPVAVTAGGNLQATALQLTAQISNVSTAPGGGVVVAAKAVSQIANLSPYPLTVWPQVGGQINGALPNTPVLIAPFGGATFLFTNTNQWSAF